MSKAKFYTSKGVVYVGSTVAITAVVLIGNAVLNRLESRRWW